MHIKVMSAMERCKVPDVKTLGQFLGGLLEIEPKQLSRLPGAPSTVMTAQFLYFAKTSCDELAEAMIRNKKSSSVLIDAAWRVKSVKEDK